jgi:hypothetical protein
MQVDISHSSIVRAQLEPLSSTQPQSMHVEAATAPRQPLLGIWHVPGDAQKHMHGGYEAMQSTASNPSGFLSDYAMLHGIGGTLPHAAGFEHAQAADVERTRQSQVAAAAAAAAAEHTDGQTEFTEHPDVLAAIDRLRDAARDRINHSYGGAGAPIEVMASEMDRVEAKLQEILSLLKEMQKKPDFGFSQEYVVCMLVYIHACMYTCTQTLTLTWTLTHMHTHALI